jgi:hypothetical protein
MAAQETAIANILEPAIWSPYFTELTTAKSALVQSGIAGSSPEIDAAASQGGRTVEMPFWDDLAHDTSADTRSKVVTDTDDVLTPAGLTTDKDVAVKHFRAQAFATAPIVRFVAGSDPAAVILGRFAEWWRKEEQRLLIQILTGVFTDATIAAALSKDAYQEDGVAAQSDPTKMIGSSLIEDTRFLLGDQFEKFTAICMHSVPFKRLRNLDLIDFVPVSTQNPLPGTTGGTKPMYMGLNVLVDDGMPAVAGTTSGYKYHTYLFGPGAFARTDIPLDAQSPNIELYREPLKGKGAGRLSIITRRYFLLHPRGIKYDGSLAGEVSPSDAELAADNWAQVYQTKNIRIARLITNG